jgi:hypothetical protein
LPDESSNIAAIVGEVDTLETSLIRSVSSRSSEVFFSRRSLKFGDVDLDEFCGGNRLRCLRLDGLVDLEERERDRKYDLGLGLSRRDLRVVSESCLEEVGENGKYRGLTDESDEVGDTGGLLPDDGLVLDVDGLECVMSADESSVTTSGFNGVFFSLIQ